MKADLVKRHFVEVTLSIEETNELVAVLGRQPGDRAGIAYRLYAALEVALGGQP